MAQSLYTPAEQVDCIVLDLEADIAHAERQAVEGPFFPGITADSLRAYADKCRAQVARIEAGRKTPLTTVNAYIAGKV
jgi:hypothetical protein